ncbi:MAG TPA: hypothetical protein VGQ28_16355 [Thermoanaerobaculia bacterium]|jgi:hypothetical protein|nr:hypothetical protein [Thermoanaerobaculia bacterium]
MPYMTWEQSVRNEPEVAQDAWIDRLLAEVERLPPASPPGGSEPATMAIAVCSAERCEREREVAAARLAEWTV